MPLTPFLFQSFFGSKVFPPHQKRRSLKILPFVLLILQSCLSLQKSTKTTDPKSTNDTKVTEWLDGSKKINLPEDKALLWIPFSWTALIAAKEAESIGKLQLSDIHLNLVEATSKKVTRVELFSTQSDPTKRGPSRTILNSEDPQKTFYVGQETALNPGQYFLKAVEFTYTESVSQKNFPVELNIPNPFVGQDKNAEKNEPIGILIQKGRVALLPRMAMETHFSQKNGSINPRSELQVYDQTVVPIDIAVRQLGYTKAQSDLFYPGSPEFPRGRIALSSPSGTPEIVEEPIATIGFLVDVPCNATGHIKFIWKRTQTDREYVSLLPLETPATCNTDNSKTLPHLALLPKGDWILKGTHIVTEPFTSSVKKVAPFANPDSRAKEFFALDNANPVFDGTLLEKDLKKPLIVNLVSMLKEHVEQRTSTADYLNPTTSNQSESLLFLGHMSLTAAKDKAENVWDLQFKRTYSLDQLTKLFKAKTFYNAYTLQKLYRDRQKGTVSSFLRVTSSENDSTKVEVLSNEFRKSATEALAQCVVEREDVDLIVSVAGTIKVSILKGSTAINLKSIETDHVGVSEKYITKCFEKKLISFKFQRKVDASFAGDLSFKSE